MQSWGHTFMVTPMTSQPCCVNGRAATLESTPPLMPTTTRAPLRDFQVGFSATEGMAMRTGPFRARSRAANGFSTDARLPVLVLRLIEVRVHHNPDEVPE